MPNNHLVFFAKWFVSVIFILTCKYSFAQLSATLAYPAIKPISYRVYIGINGSNSNVGDSLNPVADFNTALAKIKEWTAGKIGNIFAEVVLYKGTYPFSLSQSLAYYNPDQRVLNVSVRGKGNVTLDERLNPNAGATAMIHLLGSNISVKNIKIAYAAGHGTLFGYNWNNTVIVPHDIYLDGLQIEQTAGHGILVGLGRFQSVNNPIQLPFVERVWINNSVVTNAVNYNELNHTSWGSAIKLHYVKNGIISNCTSFNNGGEGIDLDDCNTILIEGSVSHDNRSNVYFDKAENVIFRNNLIFSSFRSSIGLLLSTEVSSSLIQNYYLRNLFVYNNLFLNTPCAVGYWMGTVSASQKSILNNLQVVNNTIVGKRTSGFGIFNMAYQTDMLNSNIPARNVVFEDLLWKGNIVAFNSDSLGKVFNGPLNPQPELITENNLYSAIPNVIYNAQYDLIDSSILNFGNPDSLSLYIPNRQYTNGYAALMPRIDYITNDFNYEFRLHDSTNIGAFEFDSTRYHYAYDTIVGCDSVWLPLNNEYVFIDSVFMDTINGISSDTIAIITAIVHQSYRKIDTSVWCNYAVHLTDTLFFDTTITHHGQTELGCDSITTTHYQINQSEAVVKLVHDSLLMQSSCDSIAWLNCETNEELATNENFLTEEGSFAGICWKNNCADTSNCITLSTTLIQEQQAFVCDYSIKKEGGRLLFIPKKEVESNVVSMFDSSGKLVNKFVLHSTVVSVSNIPAGIYIIVNDSGRCRTKRINWFNN